MMKKWIKFTLNLRTDIEILSTNSIKSDNYEEDKVPNLLSNKYIIMTANPTYFKTTLSNIFVPLNNYKSHSLPPTLHAYNIPDYHCKHKSHQ